MHVIKNNPFSFAVPIKKSLNPRIMNYCATNLWPLRQFKQTDLLAVDIETKGTQCASKDCEVVGLSISDHTRAIYFDKRVLKDKWGDLIEWLLGCTQLLAHNAVFDAGFLYVEAGYRWMSWTRDTHGMARQLCGEGFFGQRWGLKWLQKELLLWPESNDVDLDEWLITHGYYTGTVKKEHDTPTGRLLTYRHERTASGGLKIRPDKAEMWRAPPQILGTYCCLDSWSTLMVHDVLADAVEKKLGPIGQAAYWDYHDTFMTSVRLHVSQQLSGINTNPETHTKTEARLTEDVADLRKQFLQHAEVHDHIKEHHNTLIHEHVDKAPAKFKKLPKLGAEPSPITKAGKQSKTWVSWCAKRDKIAELGQGEVSLNWLSWSDRLTTLQAQCAKMELFNTGSDKQLIWLFHEKLGNKVMKTTDSGAPATDEEAKLQWGEPGRLLIKIDELEKRMTYVRGAYNSAIECGDDIIHMQMKLPGTVTCRLAGGGSNRNKKDAKFNIQQQPKSRDHLENFFPPPGHTLVGRDWDSMEDKVLYEVTRDPGLAKLYGPQAPPGNCAYIFVGSGLPGIGDRFKDAGYDPDDVKPEVVKRIKKYLKEDRTTSKTAKLGKNYGMGWKLFRNNLKMKGIFLSEQEAKDIIFGLDDVFPVAYKEFPDELKDEWLANKGWILSSLGQPIAVSHAKLKDLPNRCIQRSAHDMHQKSIEIVEKVANEEGFTMMWSPKAAESGKLISPWIVDLHDESMWAVPDEHVEVFEEIIKKADRDLNDWLAGHIDMTGDPERAQTLADFKVED